MNLSDKLNEKLSTKIMTIKCPTCGYEYLPAEIFIPQYLVGKPEDIERTIDGKVIIAQGLAPQLEETFECVHCNKPFHITANLSFNTKPFIKEEFKEEYTSPLYKNRINLKED